MQLKDVYASFKTSSFSKINFIYYFVLLTFCIVLQNGALCIIEISFTQRNFELLTLVKYTGYCFVSSFTCIGIYAFWCHHDVKIYGLH